jgi:hypothetical protein
MLLGQLLLLTICMGLPNYMPVSHLLHFSCLCQHNKGPILQEENIFVWLAFFLPMSTQQRTNSPGRKYLCLTFLLYSAVVAHLKGASVWEAYFLVSSKKSNSSVMYCEFSPVARRVYKVFHLVVYVLHLVF